MACVDLCGSSESATIGKVVMSWVATLVRGRKKNWVGSIYLYLHRLTGCLFSLLVRPDLVSGQIYGVVVVMGRFW